MSSPSSLRVLPSVQQVFEQLSNQVDLKDALLVQLIREELAQCRAALQTGTQTFTDRQQLLAAIVERLKARIHQLQRPAVRKVINATGVVLHTGLGRAPLGVAVWQELASLLDGYVNLEIDLRTGKRGERLELNAPLLKLLTGASAAAIVNNNAAAVVLVLNTLAEGREVLVSRGELIEIGGSFRLPEIIAKSGAQLVEVGTTNRTHLADYANALTPSTAAVLLVHPSNYRVVGFISHPERREIVAWAHRHRLPVIMDLGSGVLLDTVSVGLPAEPQVRTVIAEGCDVITFSGDKLLGGPQAGFIIGAEKYLNRIRKNPLMRALRCDKVTLTLINHTLRQYLSKAAVPDSLTYGLLTQSSTNLRRRAEHILQQLPPEVIQTLRITVQDTFTEAGSGSLPTEQLPSAALVLASPFSTAKLSSWLRENDPPVIGYSKGARLYLDFKAVLPDEDHYILEALKNLYSRCSR